MKKVLICISIIAISILILFGYKYLKNNEEPVQNNPTIASSEENFLVYIEEIIQDNDNVKVKYGNIIGNLGNQEDLVQALESIESVRLHLVNQGEPGQPPSFIIQKKREA